MVELHQADLKALQTCDTTHINLCAPDDARWAGIQTLAPLEMLQVQAGARHDFYVLHGGVQERGQTRAAGTFFSRNQALTLRADAQGALLLWYRDTVARSSGHETWAHDELEWWAGAVRGMQVAPLSKLHHRVSLVRWQAGTRAALHTHPHGEDIFVLAGELRDERGAYPAGTWMRFHPGSGHAPYAEQETLILLRNGHLSTSTLHAHRLKSPHTATSTHAQPL